MVIEDESDCKCVALMNRIVGDGMESLVAERMSATLFSSIAAENVSW